MLFRSVNELLGEHKTGRDYIRGIAESLKYYDTGSPDAYHIAANMKIAIIYSFLAGFSLILGVIIGTVFKIGQRAIAAIMAFGSGVLICALTFGLMEEAFKHGGFDAIVIGFLIGGVVFIGGDFLVHRYGGRNHKKNKHFKSIRETNGKAIILGASLDGIPE